MSAQRDFEWGLAIIQKLFHNLLYLNIFDQNVPLSPQFIAMQIWFFVGVVFSFWMIIDDAEQWLIGLTLGMDYSQVCSNLFP